MAEEITIELLAKFDKVTAGLKDVEKKLETVKTEGVKSFKKVEKQAKVTAKATKGIGKALSGVGAVLTGGAFKLGAVIMEKLMDLFMSNQRVVDAMSTATEFLGIVFGDLVSLFDKSVEGIKEFFGVLLTDPMSMVDNLAKSIKESLMATLDQLMNGIGLLGSALQKLFDGDFAGAGSDLVKGITEINKAVNPVVIITEKLIGATVAVGKGMADYATNTFKAASSLTALNKQSKLAEAQNALLLQQYDKETELQRQIRDDTSRNIEDRIAANEELGRVLDRQAIAMMSNAQLQLDAAQAALNLDKENLDLQIAVIDKKRELADVDAAVTGFRAEQLTNINTLLKEQQDLIDADKDKKIEDKEASDELLAKQEEDDLKAGDLKEKLRLEELAGKVQNLDFIRKAAGEESAIGKALFVARQAMIIKEQIAEAKATLAKITMKSAEAGVATATGVAETAKVGFPQNIPLLIAFAAQAVGIFSAINAAVSAAKGAVSSSGGGGGGPSAPTLTAPSAPPAFNVVGSAPENQLANTIAGQQNKPLRSYVVSSEISSQQSLDRQIEETATLG